MTTAAPSYIEAAQHTATSSVPTWKQADMLRLIASGASPYKSPQTRHQTVGARCLIERCVAAGWLVAADGWLGWTLTDCGVEALRRATPKSAADRFWSKVDKNGPTPVHCPEVGQCWVWTAFRKPNNGYGTFKGEGGKRGTIILAHRFSYSMLADIPNGMRVLHRCDNPACVRPEHLFLGSQKDNVHDCIAKGRHVNPSGRWRAA